MALVSWLVGTWVSQAETIPLTLIDVSLVGPLLVNNCFELTSLERPINLLWKLDFNNVKQKPICLLSKMCSFRFPKDDKRQLPELFVAENSRGN